MNDIEMLIAKQDEVISLQRQGWIDAKTKEDKAKWYKQIEESLDKRLEMMKKRDAEEIDLNKEINK